MNWNQMDFVLSADAQFNGSTVEHVHNVDHYMSLEPRLASQYQVVVSQELERLLPGGRKHESLGPIEMIGYVRNNDETVLGYPAEFYQSQLQKPCYRVDFKQRHTDLMGLVGNGAAEINAIYDHAFSSLYAHGTGLDESIDRGVYHAFPGLDHEMAGILAGYLKQKPVRTILLIDMEAVNHDDGNAIFRDAGWYFRWLETPYRALVSALEGFGIPYLTVVTGKGYHLAVSVPLVSPRGGMSPAMLELMAIGGILQEETLQQLVLTEWESRKTDPVPPLSQRAYQGANKLLQFLVVNLIDRIRAELSHVGMPPLVGFTDNNPFQISIDLTGGLRQVEMGCFGSVGSVYNKRRDHFVVRVPRARSGHDFFGGDIDRMLATRGNPELAKSHLIATGGAIPDGEDGILRLIAAYKKSRIKRELHDACERALDFDTARELIRTNYGWVRREFPEINGILDQAQPLFLNPSALEFVYGVLGRKLSVFDMMQVTYAVYHDTVKKLDIEPKYSKAEWCRWPVLLLGEHYKG